MVLQDLKVVFDLLNLTFMTAGEEKKRERKLYIFFPVASFPDSTELVM